MKIAFFGTSTFSADILKDILKFSDLEIVLVVSQPDKAVGRKQEFLVTLVKGVALQNNISVLQPEKLGNNPFFTAELHKLDLDFIVVVAYGKIIPQEILSIPRFGSINIHGSLLPKYRGASPVQTALKNGDKETGLTIMYMNKKMDEGDILVLQKVSIHPDDTSIDIFRKFNEIGPKLLYNTLLGVLSKTISPTSQDHIKATYCHMIEKYQGEIYFSKKTAQEIYNLYRAYMIWPGIYTVLNAKKMVLEKVSLGEMSTENPGTFVRIDKKTYGVVCADQKILLIHQIKPEGKKSMDIVSFVNGNKEVLKGKLL